jgi:hypothetical protein
MTWEPKIDGIVAARAEFWGYKADAGAKVCLRNGDSADEDYVTAEVDREHIAPWASAEEWEAVGRHVEELDTQIDELLTLLGGPYDDPVSNDEIGINTAHHRAENTRCDFAPLRDRLGW